MRYRKLGDVDLRTRAGRRANDLIHVFEDALGSDLTEDMRIRIARAAIMTALAEDARMRKLAGEAISLDELVTVELNATTLERWRRHPMTFIEEVLHDPETRRPYRLLPAERREDVD